jgi:hypothetical protein
MMYEALYHYLLQYKELQVPGIGSFLLERKPAVADFPNKQIHPPTYNISMQQGGSSPSKNFYNWLGYQLNVPEREAIIKFNDFAFELKKEINDAALVEWQGVGILSKGLGGDVKFAPTVYTLPEQSVHAEKVIREKAEHMVRVGEEQKTSAEMEEMLSHTEEKRSYWWMAALAALVLGLMFIGWHFSSKGVDVGAAANSKKLIPAESSSATYKLVP